MYLLCVGASEGKIDRRVQLDIDIKPFIGKYRK